MKTAFVLVAALAATITTAAAQGGVNSKNGTTTSGGVVSPTASKPNYTPGKVNTTPKTAGQVTRSGGQGHNTTHPPKGQIQMAPTTPATGKSGATSSSNVETIGKNAAPKASGKSGGQ